MWFHVSHWGYYHGFVRGSGRIGKLAGKLHVTSEWVSSIYEGCVVNLIFVVVSLFICFNDVVQRY